MKRYSYKYDIDAPHDSGMVENPSGDYVEFSEVEKLVNGIALMLKMGIHDIKNLPPLTNKEK